MNSDFTSALIAGLLTNSATVGVATLVGNDAGTATELIIKMGNDCGCGQ